MLEYPSNLRSLATSRVIGRALPAWPALAPPSAVTR
jgi:hypothetical protein